MKELVDTWKELGLFVVYPHTTNQPFNVFTVEQMPEIKVHQLTSATQ